MATGALSTQRATSSVESVKETLSMIASLIVPGLGQLGRGRLKDGALFLAWVLWLRLVLASYGWILTSDKDALGAALWGAFALPEPSSAPLALVVTGLVVATHAAAALDARRHPLFGER